MFAEFKKKLIDDMSTAVSIQKLPMSKKRTALEADIDVPSPLRTMQRTESYEALLLNENAGSMFSLQLPLRDRKCGTCRVRSPSLASAPPSSIHVSLTNSQNTEFDVSDLHVLNIGPLSGLHWSNNGGQCKLFANFILGSIAHRCELDDDTNVSVKNEFFVRRECLFASGVARRTKFKVMQPDIRDRRPLAFLWTDHVNGTITRITNTVAIRNILAELYTRLLVNSKQFQMLLSLMSMGFDILLSGDTDNVPHEPDDLQSELWKCFNWESVLADALNVHAQQNETK